MGIWWKKVVYVPCNGIFVNGRKKSWPKIFFFWRFQHPWKVFKVCTEEAYWVYFSDDTINMRCRKKITTSYFAARIGQSDIVFSAINSRKYYRPESLKIISFPKLFTWTEIRQPRITLEEVVVNSKDITLI